MQERYSVYKWKLQNVAMTKTDVDIIVIGGGINGVGIARDAAGRGFSVILCEKDDLAQHTSSSSTKLIHGGLRYLEFYDFKLVRSALKEREVLLRAAPHIIWPLRFVLPHHPSLRPRWLIRLGLFLYDHIGGRKILPASKAVKLSQHVAGKPLKSSFTHAFEYSDCWVQDSRLVVLSAMDAAKHGAQILTHTECVGLSRKKDLWQVQLQDKKSGKVIEKTAKVVVNASGPWVDKTLKLNKTGNGEHHIRLVKGSHIVVPKLFNHSYPYIFQNADNRILFAIPYEQDFTLIGTTDVEVKGDPEDSAIEQSEINYLCSAASEYFVKPISKDMVRWTYSGVRPLYDDAVSNASKITRDYKLNVDTEVDGVDAAAILSVYGGKITTFRKLSEQVVNLLQPHLGREKENWTAKAFLPGGDIPNADFAAFVKSCEQQYPWLDKELLYYYARNYGTLINKIIGESKSMNKLGLHFGGLLYLAEVKYLQNHEWAISADDILWRRSKHGLHLSEDGQNALKMFLAKND